MSLGDNYIRVLWTCGMQEKCINKEQPGLHPELTDCEECVTGKRPAKPSYKELKFPEL